MRLHRLLAALTIVPLVGAAAPAVSTADGPISDTMSSLEIALCDDTDLAQCLFPFPNDHFTVADASEVTGRRVNLSPLAMPQNRAGRPIDPTEWNTGDGFSPGALAMTFVPGLDLEATWREALDDEDAAATTIEDLARSLDEDAPIVVINATTGERHPYFDELDTHPETADDERLLLIRPAVNYEEGHRYVIALRDLVGQDGEELQPARNFAGYAEGRGPKGAKQLHMDANVFPVLEAAGIDRDEVYLAWDFTVASWQSLAGRVLHMRDEAFALLGDHDLADLEVQGVSPEFTIDYVDEGNGNAARIVHGAVTVPNFLTHPQERLDLGRYDRDGYDVPGVMAPGSRLFYGNGSRLPQINPVAPTMEVPFICAIPNSAVGDDGRVADPARPALYGHGLLGSRQEGAYWSGGRHMLANHGLINCGVDWLGMATEDLSNVGMILTDASNMPSLADRAQQGFLGFLFVGRAMIHPDGFSSDARFQDVDGAPLFDTSELVYDGNSQGAIMGGALTAIAPDFTKAVLGVPGMNYSTLLNRSVDWEGEFLDPTDPDLPAYSQFMYQSYPDKQEQQLVFSLIQMLWDRAESNGYAHHMTDDPYPNTPAHQVILHVAFGDFQVANIAAEVEARTIGARAIHSALAPGRPWARDPWFGMEDFIDGQWSGSALVYMDSGNLVPPVGNVPPAHVGSDPHGHPRNDVMGGIQKHLFYETGIVFDTRDGAAWWTTNCPAQSEEPVACGG